MISGFVQVMGNPRSRFLLPARRTESIHVKETRHLVEVLVECEERVDAGRERRQRQTVLLQGRVASAVGMHFNALQLLRIPRMEDVLNGRAALQQLRDRQSTRL